MEDDLELKALKLKKMMKLMASKKNEEKREELTFEEALKIVKEHLGDRGDEVLNAAIQQYPEQTRKIILMLAVKIKTKILYYKKGEYKAIGDLIK